MFVRAEIANASVSRLLADRHTAGIVKNSTRIAT
jgi:hypothetical protein